MNLNTQRDIDQLITIAAKASLRAGKAIMEVYETNFTVESKADQSPLTEADKRAHEVIKEWLQPTGYPILSEEGREISYAERKTWETFWLVDPLDGTKEFIKRNGEFTVNIALIHNRLPLLGVVFSPVLHEFYYAGPGWGSRKSNIVPGDDGHFDLPPLEDGRQLPIEEPGRPFTVVGSRSHGSQETELFIRQLRQDHPDLVFVSKGSSLKLCLIAEGKADIYPRLAPTMEWDTGAGHALVRYSGGTVTRYEDGDTLEYNKEDLLNPWFVAKRR